MQIRSKFLLFMYEYSSICYENEVCNHLHVIKKSINYHQIKSLEISKNVKSKLYLWKYNVPCKCLTISTVSGSSSNSEVTSTFSISTCSWASFLLMVILLRLRKSVPLLTILVSLT